MAQASAPPPQYTGPPIHEDVPWHTRTHIQLLYQKLGEQTQAINLLQQQINALKGGK